MRPPSSGATRATRLASRKTAEAAERVATALDAEPRVELDRAEADRWVRDPHRPAADGRHPARHPRTTTTEVPEGLVGEVYHWLGELQGGIIAALDVRTRMPGWSRPMSLELTADEFEKIVIDELDELPDEMVDGLENLVFVTEDRPEDGSLDLLGIYEGVALTERDRYGFGELPDRIVLFREPLLAICDDLDELRDEIHITLVHEIAHYYGIDDDELHRLGWA